MFEIFSKFIIWSGDIASTYSLGFQDPAINIIIMEGI